MHKFKSLEELREEKKKLDSLYEEGLPQYLIDYFDKEEKRISDKEYFKQKHSEKYKYTQEERKEFVKQKEEEFWQENKTEIVKSPKTIGKHLKPIYEEPPRGVNDSYESMEERIAHRYNGESNIYLFALRYFKHYLKKPNSSFHKFIYNLLSRELGSNKKRIDGFKWAIAAPRFNAKSSIISTILPIWCVCYEKKKFIVLLSDTASQAEDFLSDIKRELENNTRLKEDFPNVCGKGPQWRSTEIITANNIKILSLGTGSQIRGRKYGINRPDLVIGDDLETSDLVRSPVQRDFIRYQWFDKDVMFAGGEKGTATDFIVVGTILGKDSLLNALLDPKDYPDWQSRRFAAVIQFSESALWDEWEKIYKNRFDDNREKAALKFFKDHKEEMLEGTKVLWPEGDPYYDLMVYKISKPSAFISEKQNDATDPLKILVNEDSLSFANFRSGYLNDKLIQQILQRAVYFGAIDPSMGKKSKSGDYSAIVTLARDIKTGYLLVVDMDVRRRDIDTQINDILKAHLKYHYKGFAVETNAFQFVIADTLRKMSRELGGYVPIREIHQYVDKKIRFEGILPLLTDGTIIFDNDKRYNSQRYNLGLEQITTFTGDNDKYDDVPDALVSAVDIAKKPRFRMICRSNR